MNVLVINGSPKGIKEPDTTEDDRGYADAL